MDDLMARTMVENLSIGINPLDGRLLPKTDACSNRVIQEALKTILEHCDLDSYATILEKEYREKREKSERRKKLREAKRNAEKDNRTNGENEWSKTDDWKLESFYHNGYDAEYIAKMLGFPKNVILKKLIQNGLEK